MITLLEGEFFGEDEIVNNNNPNENFGQRTYSAFVSSPKASVYVCPIQFFKKYIFERPNLLKKLQEKYYIKKNLWEKQLSNCLIQRKDIYHKEISSYRKEDLPHLTVFSDKRNEENKPTLNLLTPLNSNEQISIKKSVIDLKSKISEMTHQNVFKNELSNSIIKKQKGKFINIDSLQITTSNDEKNNSTSNIPLSSVKNKSSSFESHIKFINKKYDQLMKDNKNNISECFHFQSDKDNHLQSRMNVYLKGKFKRYFNKSQTDEKLDNYKNSHNIKKFNDSLMKSIKTIKEREKIDFNSFRINHLENSVRDQDSVDKLFIKKNKQLIYINRIDLFSESLEASMKNNK